jgi:hypothetical protein
LPRYSYTAAVAKAVGDMPEMSQLIVSPRPTIYDPEALHLLPLLTQKCPPTLTEVSIEVDENFIPVLEEAAPLLSRLTHLQIVCCRFHCPSMVLRFFTILGSQCFNLRVLQLDLSSPKYSETWLPLTFESIRELFPIKGLCSLEINHTMPITLEVDAVREMAAAWGRLTTCILSPKAYPWGDIPSEFQVHLTPISILSAFVTEFPHLKTLGLYLDVEETPTCEEKMHLEIGSHKLSILDVGCSPIDRDNIQAAAFYLGALFSPNLEIRIHGSSEWSTASRILSAEEALSWEDVAHLTAKVSSVRETLHAQYKAAMDLMNARIASLQDIIDTSHTSSQ